MTKITHEEKAKIIEQLEEAIKTLETLGDRFSEKREHNQRRHGQLEGGRTPT